MRDYSSAKIELMALKWSACEKFKDYLLGSKFTVFTDNNPLVYVKTSKLGAAQIRWLSELALYDFDIVYRTGRSNLVADALSRRPEVEGVAFWVNKPLLNGSIRIGILILDTM